MVAVAIAVWALGCRTHESPPPIGDATAAGVCPRFLDLEFDGTNSKFKPGWTGNAHGVGLPTGSTLSVEITACDAECRRCKFHGPVRGAAGAVITQRCLAKASRVCAIDDDCKPDAGGKCRFMFAPIASNVLLPTCSLVYFEPIAMPDPSPIQGTIDLQTGESDMPVLNLNIGLAVENCVDCLRDPQPFDGVAGGQCGGTGPACDVNGVSTTGITSSTSFDCPPSPAQTTIVLGTNGTSTSSVGWTMDDTRPMCTATTAAGKRCWCGMCSDGKPCTAGKDCADGVCGVGRDPRATNIPWSVANNSCMGSCNWDAATQTGRCSSPAGQSCFPDADPMIARGFAEVRDGYYDAQLANLICMPSFRTNEGFNAFVDGIGGFPGPFLVEARFRVEKRGMR